MLRTALVLGLLAAVGPFAIDMYLPALPAIEADLGATTAEVQMTLTTYFLAFGLAQLVYGPWSDAAGRKRPLFVGLGLFLVASIGCVVAPDAATLAAFRFVQGAGAAVLMAVPRAMIRDEYTGVDGTRLMAMVMLVISVSPMLAPLAGSGLLAVSGWRGIFVAVAVAAVVSLIVLAVAQHETLPPERRTPVRIAELWRGTKILATEPVFMGLTFIAGFGMASFFVFLASASFVYTGQYGLTPTGFSLAFAVNAVSFFGASQIAAPLGQRYGMVRVLSVGIFGFAAATTALLGIYLAGGGSLPVVMAGLFVGNFFLGLVIPTTMVVALDPHGRIAGLAASLGGTLQMLTGGAMIAASAPLFDGTALPMVATIAVCGWAASAIALFVLPRLRAGAGAAPAE